MTKSLCVVYFYTEVFKGKLNLEDISINNININSNLCRLFSHIFYYLPKIGAVQNVLWEWSGANQ